MNKDDFLYPRTRYYGQVKPENIVFNANLQEFAQKITYICSLETSGKISPEEAYHQIKALWQQLRQSKKELGIGDNPFSNDQEK
ncbi:hypothetical protein G7B40_018440 [Aetokthonos hydrillicola Thurmond2011]|uniref:Isopropylmalate/homocitrate/citramalate synthases n=1 Tax=Aetokthonos hydrillicola Thurmond2011 TaxID=2712845 RepID=A0AAP5MB84_9CYAN|nr:hypothetical protein [Aetokthonos hydrillicola]MBO3460533.1 hypothetical protein [Aetokthonos hydrillicola CCALA 1050]MBW4585339.1 hypothetical protein [Aetokthonos hydrillicola CCALA 1050]MDR9896524.1 hypothetical protein [Aetokthonos hydrillicola Thurmond2011]